MGRLVKFIIALYVWHLIVFTFMTCGAYYRLKEDIPLLRLYDVNPFTNQVTFCVIGIPICIPYMTINPIMLFIDPYNFIMPLKIMSCL